MDTFYSQHGEDFLINKIFADRTNGYYVEIGCLDGIEYSNTYYFEKKGWRGACIEAHNDFIPALKKNRPNASIVHCAVGEDNKESVTFYANKVGSLSTLDKSEEERWQKAYKDHFFGFEEQKVAMRTLTSIFDQLNIENIDFISLDIEGYEVQALKGLDLQKYRPRIFIIEYKDDVHKQELENILLKNEYHFLGHIGCNLFYGTDVADKKIVLGEHGKVELLLVDQEGKEHVHEVNFNRARIIDKVKFIAKKSFLGKAWTYWLRKRAEGVSRTLPTYEEKRNIIENYRDLFQLDCLVETGTFLGDTVEYFRDKFQRIISVELSEELASNAMKRFETFSHISIIQGDSGVVLKDVVKDLASPSLFWLDGHYSSDFFVGDKHIKTARADKDTPIHKELQILLNDRFQHLILIDDARLFTGRGDYPTLHEIKDLVKKSPFVFDVFVRQDIIHIIPKR